MDHMIRHCESAAVFQVDDHTKPIAWAMQHPFGHIGHVFTLEEYRRKGFASIVNREIVKKIKDDGNLPECFMESDNPNTNIVQKLGFVSMYQMLYLKVKNN